LPHSSRSGMAVAIVIAAARPFVFDPRLW
jgi:hypothetical protein